ncbi:AraC family transcriptional regulator [Streptomyces fumanus]|uniref:HTH araC/xylS-type domain-containing protein n=1 Tax=Streptomyces fumanus TaxID=67302 RepID=A0A919AA15_9ACTN|nr:AraC family transcriptional regulator [Streptomyces fumanus]GHE93897.1 hypothetical protein GCM10018772_17130 [Streptomyces fumanus]
MTDLHRTLSWQTLMAEKQIAREENDTLTYQMSKDWFAIVTPLRGSCQIEGRDDSGRRRTTLMAGDICRIVPNNPVRLTRAPRERLPLEVAYIQMPAEILRHARDAQPTTTVRDLSTLHTLRAFEPHVASIMTEMLHARTTGAGDHYAASAARYLAAYLLHPRHRASPSAGGLSPEQLLAVTTYMEENLASNITLDQLAKEASISRYHFLRRFSTSTGKTPMRYLTELRIDAARHLLAVDSETISQVGRRCGFPNAENFARVFRRHVGCSPSQYRQRGQRG